MSVFNSRSNIISENKKAVIRRNLEMGNQLVWNNRYNLGIEIIDKEHKKLFRILGRLFDFRQQSQEVSSRADRLEKGLNETKLNLIA